MSILNCHTRLTIINCTGLPATFSMTPKEDHIRLQPLDDAHVEANVATSATSLVEWVREWVHLVSYGPTYDKFKWVVAPGASETVRIQTENTMGIHLEWSDASVSWAKQKSGMWSVDISKAMDVTMYLRADVGEYVHQRTSKGPAAVKSVKLKPYLEIACDDDIPFTIDSTPIADMFWSPQINLQQIVNPEET